LAQWHDQAKMRAILNTDHATDENVFLKIKKTEAIFKSPLHF
jgi:hypothetical protein